MVLVSDLEKLEKIAGHKLTWGMCEDHNIVQELIEKLDYNQKELYCGYLLLADKRLHQIISMSCAEKISFILKVIN